MLTRISGRPAAYEASHGHSINDYSDRLLLAALLVLAGLEVVLVARANDGGVTARLVEEPLAEGLLGTGLMGRMGWDVKGQGATFVGLSEFGWRERLFDIDRAEIARRRSRGFDGKFYPGETTAKPRVLESGG